MKSFSHRSIPGCHISIHVSVSVLVSRLLPDLQAPPTVRSCTTGAGWRTFADSDSVRRRDPSLGCVRVAIAPVLARRGLWISCERVCACVRASAFMCA